MVLTSCVANAFILCHVKSQEDPSNGWRDTNEKIISSSSKVVSFRIHSHGTHVMCCEYIYTTPR